MAKRSDLTGQKFGRLKVLRFSHNGPNYAAYWECVCDCGNVKTMRVAELKSGDTKSCGCYLKECAAERARNRSTHGHTINRKPSPTYKSWDSMIRRCKRKPPHHCYYDYVARGITVCERWERFETFLEDMGERPEGMTLDRIDVDGNYCKANCRWATPKEQANNRRKQQ